MAERWGLIVEESKGGRYGFVYAHVLEVFTGSRADALTRLEAHATTYRPRRGPYGPRTRLFRSSDGFLMVSGDAPSEYASDWHTLCRFTVAELLRDSEDTRRTADAEWRERAEVERQEREAKRSARRARRM